MRQLRSTIKKTLSIQTIENRSVSGMGRTNHGTTNKTTTKKQGKSPQKQQQQRQPRKLSIPDLMQAAEHAVAVEDLRYAVTLYTVALHKGQTVITNNSAAANSTNSANNDTSLLPLRLRMRHCDVLERRAEVYVTLEETDAARLDYQAALDALVQAEEMMAVSAATSTLTATVAAAATAVADVVLPRPDELWHRQAGLHMYIGQLSTAQQALTSYQAGHDLLRRAAAETTRPNNPHQHSVVGAAEAVTRDFIRVCCSMAELYLTDLCLEPDAEDECERYLQQALDPSSLSQQQQQQQHHLVRLGENVPTAAPHADTDMTAAAAAAAAAADASIHGTDSTSVTTTTPRHDTSMASATTTTTTTTTNERDAAQMEAWQLLASLRLSQQRNMEAATIVMSRVYIPFLAVPCRAVAALVGLSSTGSTDCSHPHDTTVANGGGGGGGGDDPNGSHATTTLPATELTEREMELVQALPDFAVRCQTAKVLLECAHGIQNGSRVSGHDTNHVSSTDQDPLQQQQQPNTNRIAVSPLACATAAVTVLASLVAENDEVIELWTLLGDALFFIEQGMVDNDTSPTIIPTTTATTTGSTCGIYWERALEMLQVVQASLEEEIRDNTMHVEDDDDDNDAEEDAMQQQLDEVLSHIEELQAKLAGAVNGDEDDMST